MEGYVLKQVDKQIGVVEFQKVVALELSRGFVAHIRIEAELREHKSQLLEVLLKVVFVRLHTIRQLNRIEFRLSNNTHGALMTAAQREGGRVEEQTVSRSSTQLELLGIISSMFCSLNRIFGVVFSSACEQQRERCE